MVLEAKGITTQLIETNLWNNMSKRRAVKDRWDKGKKIRISELVNVISTYNGKF